MIRPICKDTMLLARKARPAAAEDAAIAADLRDTLAANRDACVGMAANMIGQPVAVIAVAAGPMILTMLNPQITAKAGPFEAEEGCLSLNGVRRTTRYRQITVRYQDEQLRWHEQRYTGWTAQIIQHECDHLQGILI